MYYQPPLTLNDSKRIFTTIENEWFVNSLFMKQEYGLDFF